MTNITRMSFARPACCPNCAINHWQIFCLLQLAFFWSPLHCHTVLRVWELSEFPAVTSSVVLGHIWRCKWYVWCVKPWSASIVFFSEFLECMTIGILLTFNTVCHRSAYTLLVKHAAHVCILCSMCSGHVMYKDVSGICQTVLCLNGVFLRISRMNCNRYCGIAVHIQSI